MAKISQKSLVAIVRQRAKVAAAQSKLDELEKDLKAQLESAVPVAPGLFRAELKKWDRRSPAWREVVEREIDKIRGAGEGFKFAERVLAGTTPTPCEKLIVEPIA